jgi:hypothetical protein
LRQRFGVHGVRQGKIGVRRHRLAELRQRQFMPNNLA